MFTIVIFIMLNYYIVFAGNVFSLTVLLPSTPMEAVRSQCNIKETVIMIPAVYPIYHLSDSLICDTFLR